MALALRPGFSSPSPDCHRRRIVRHEAKRRGLLVLTAGLVVYFYRRYSTVPVAASLHDERSVVLARLFLARLSIKRRKAYGHDAYRTRSGSNHVGKVCSRARGGHAAVTGHRGSTPSERSANGVAPQPGSPARSEWPDLFVADPFA